MTTYPKVYKDQRLRADAADSYKRLATTFSPGSGLPTLTVRSGYRSDAEQEKIFLARYTTAYTQYAPGRVDAQRYNGRVYYRKPGFASAAAPGRSNHRSGLAADFGPTLTSFSSVQFKALAKVAPYFGWDNAEGRSVNEPWHWVYTPKNDKSLTRRGWYHVKASKTNVYSVKTGKKSYTRKQGFDVYVSHGILLLGVEWLVTNYGNRYRATHLAKGKAPAKPKPVPKYRTVYVSVSALNGRSSPDTSTKKNIKFVRPKGFKLVVRDVPSHPEWVVTRYNTYYWKAHTK